MRITESELKQVIRESVESVLLNEDMQSKRNRKYEDALTNYNNAQKTWDQLNDDEKKPWMINAGGDETAGRNAYEYAQKTRVANAKAKLDKRTRRNGLQFQQDLQTANSQLKNLYTTLGAKDYKSAAVALTKLKMNLQTTQSKLDTANQSISDLQKTNTDLRTKNAELTKANQNLNQQIAAANQARMQNTAASALNRQATTAQFNAKMPGANNSASALNTNPQRTAADGTAKA